MQFKSIDENFEIFQTWILCNNIFAAHELVIIKRISFRITFSSLMNQNF